MTTLSIAGDGGLAIKMGCLGPALPEEVHCDLSQKAFVGNCSTHKLFNNSLLAANRFRMLPLRVLGLFCLAYPFRAAETGPPALPELPTQANLPQR